MKIFPYILLITGSLSLAASTLSASMTAEEILQKAMLQYAQCQAYHDTGTVETVFIHSDHRRTTKKEFSTHLSRDPGRFRFEYHEVNRSDSRYIIWAAGRDVRTWWGVTSREEAPSSLSGALAAATGVSGGSARRIPGLLLRDRIGAGWDIKDLTIQTRLPDEIVDGVDCYRLQAREPVVIWICKESFLIRKIEERRHFSADEIPAIDQDFQTVTTTTYSPEINERIPDSAFRFDRPND